MVNRFRSLFLITLVSFYSSITFAAPVLIVTDKFTVISVNGESFSHGLFQQKAEVNLKTGSNKIALRYKELFEGDYGDEHEIISSDIFVIQTDIEKKQNYTLQYLKPSDVSAARRYAREPVVSIVDQQGHRLKVENIYLAAQSTGFVNQATRIKLPKQEMLNITSPKTVNVKKSNDSSSEQAMAQQMLIFWWNKADAKQRRAFLEQIKDKQ